MAEIIGYQPYRGYIDTNKNPLTGQEEDITTFEPYNSYTRYPTFDSAFNDISTAYGGKLKTFKIDTVYAPDVAPDIGSIPPSTYSIFPIPNKDIPRYDNQATLSSGSSTPPSISPVLVGVALLFLGLK